MLLSAKRQPVTVDTVCEGNLLVLCSASPHHVNQQGSDISRLALQLQQQWDHALNAHLKFEFMTCGVLASMVRERADSCCIYSDS